MIINKLHLTNLINKYGVIFTHFFNVNKIMICMIYRTLIIYYYLFNLTLKYCIDIFKYK